jgi:hypothetical protein
MRRPRAARTIHVRFVAAALGLASLLGPVLATRTAHAVEPVGCPSADGAPGKRARMVFDQAVQLEASEPERALRLYQCAATIADRAVIELRIGVVAERLQQDDVAITAFERYLALAGKSAPDVDKMQQHVAEMRANHAKRAADADNRNKAAPAPITPITPPAIPPPPDGDPDGDAHRSSTPLYLGWALVGGGVVVGTVATILLVNAKEKSDDVHNLPIGTSWTSDDARGAYDSAKRSQTIGIVCLVVAPLLVAGGVVVLATRGKQRSAASAALTTHLGALSF